MQTIKTLYNQPILTGDGNPPTTVKVLTPIRTEFVGGTLDSRHRSITYVLFDVLPDELKRKVFDAIQALAAAM